MRTAMMVFLLAGFGAAADARTADEWLKLAEGRVAQSKLAEAWETLDDALAAHPGEARLCVALGDLFIRLAEAEQSNGSAGSTITNYYLDAERMYDEVLAANTKSAAALYGKARANHGLSGTVAGTASKAAVAVSRCLEIEAGHGGALALQGHLRYAERKYAEASRCYVRALARGESDVTIHVRIGHCAYALGKKDDAKAAYLEGLRRHPLSAVPIRSGLYYLAGKDWRKASSLLREATEVAPQSSPAWFYFGYCHYVGARWAPAVAAFGMAAKLDPKHASAHYYVGASMDKRGDGDEALDPWRRALRLNPAHTEAAGAFDNRIRAGQRPMRDSMRLYEELLELAPANPWIRNNYAYLLRDAAEMRGAANTARIPDSLFRMLRRSGQVYEAVARLCPDDPQIQSDTGLIYEFYPAIHDDKKAAAYFTRALDLTGSRYRDALKGLIRLCERTHDWKTLHAYTSEAAAAFAAGECGLYPTEAGELLPTGRLGTELLRAEVDAALAMAKHNLFHPGTGRKMMVPVVRRERGGAEWKVPNGWGIEMPASDPRGKPVKLAMDRAPGAIHQFKARVAVAGGLDRGWTRSIDARLVVDGVEAGAVRTTWTSRGDDAVGDGCLIALLGKAGRFRAGSVEAIDVRNARLEPTVARAMHMAIVPLPDHPVRVGETWAVPLELAMVCDTVLPLSDAEVQLEAYQTLVGFERVDSHECARLEMVFAATIRSRSLMIARHMGKAPGTVHMKGSCVMLLGADGHVRRVTWKKSQWCKLDRRKGKQPPLPPKLARLAKLGRLRTFEMRRQSTWEIVGIR